MRQVGRWPRVRVAAMAAGVCGVAYQRWPSECRRPVLMRCFCCVREIPASRRSVGRHKPSWRRMGVRGSMAASVHHCRSATDGAVDDRARGGIAVRGGGGRVVRGCREGREGPARDTRPPRGMRGPRKGCSCIPHPAHKRGLWWQEAEIFFSVRCSRPISCASCTPHGRSQRKGYPAGLERGVKLCPRLARKRGVWRQ